MNRGVSLLCKSVLFGVLAAGQVQAQEPEYVEDETAYSEQDKEMAQGWGWQGASEQAMLGCGSWGTDCSSTIDPCEYFDFAVAAPEPGGALSNGFGNKLTGTTVYVGGVRYSLSKSSFTPVYEDLSNGECPNGTKLTGYKTSLSVVGDNGQSLIFDMSGQSDRSVSLTASCGSFSGSDSGTKYIIAREMSTGGSCRNMNLTFKFNWRLPPASLNLNLSILEKF